MGLLGEIYSFGNRTRNKLRGLLDDPKGYLQQTADQTANTLRDMTGANETAQQFALRDKINAGDKNALEQYRNLEKTIQNKLFDVALNNNPAAVGMFVGKGAKTADLAKLAQAEQRIAAGDDAAKVWAETGWGKGPDGHWRFEIPDNLASVEPRKTKTTTEYGYLKTPQAEVAKRQLDALDAKIDAHPKGMEHYFDSNPGSWDEWQRLSAEAKGQRMVDKATTNDKLGYLLDHDPIYQNYDSAFNIPTQLTTGRFAGSGGEYSRNWLNTGQESIGVKAYDAAEAKSPLLHELQHSIQQREGFAKGGSPEMFPSANSVNDAQIIQAQIKRGMMPSEAAKWMRETLGRSPDIHAMDLATSGKAFTTPSNPNEAYRRLAGEAEARLTQSRMNMDAAQRAKQYPWEPGYFQEATGVPLNGLLFR